jgi:hypothetical protein
MSSSVSSSPRPSAWQSIMISHLEARGDSKLQAMSKKNFLVTNSPRDTVSRSWLHIQLCFHLVGCKNPTQIQQNNSASYMWLSWLPKLGHHRFRGILRDGPKQRATMVSQKQRMLLQHGFSKYYATRMQKQKVC